MGMELNTQHWNVRHVSHQGKSQQGRVFPFGGAY